MFLALTLGKIVHLLRLFTHICYRNYEKRNHRNRGRKEFIQMGEMNE